jgi:hypothetical protein
MEKVRRDIETNPNGKNFKQNESIGKSLGHRT